MTQQHIDKLADELLNLNASEVGTRLEQLEAEYGKEKTELILKAMFRRTNENGR